MVVTKKPMPINLSFSGCGFLGLYHVGVVCAFKEHAPEVLQNPIAGCSAGSLVAACTMCGCCLGQMCSDALEIAIRARSLVLGPLHPTFDIVDIIRNGLRRILPPNAHEICSGRLFISLTRWKDNKNVIVSQFQSREELVQVLVCSSFVPFWSGLIPPKFRNEYHWDGGLTNNNPIIDEGTILISPFAGESDICPRDESGSFYSVDFRGTDISCTQENAYRMTRALFPPDLDVLKQLCWRGYIDGLKFLQMRNMIQSTYVNNRTSISSVLGTNYTEPGTDEEEELANGGIAQGVEQMFERVDEIEEESMDGDGSYEGSAYQSEDESVGGSSQATFSPFCEKVTRRRELPTPLFAVFADARQREEAPIRRYFMDSRVYKIGSLMALPVTLPIDLTYAVTKRLLGVFRPTAPPAERTLPSRAIDYICSFLGDENESQSCYHVNDCECTESRPSSVAGGSTRINHRTTRRRVVPRRLQQSSPRLNRRVHSQDPSFAPRSTAASTSSRSNSPSDDEDMSVHHHDETQDLSSEATPVRHLTAPAPVSSIRSPSSAESYCQQLQEMAELSHQHQAHEQSSSTTLPFFGKDDPVVQTATDPMPTSTLEQNVLFN